MVGRCSSFASVVLTVIRKGLLRICGWEKKRWLIRIIRNKLNSMFNHNGALDPSNFPFKIIFFFWA